MFEKDLDKFRVVLREKYDLHCKCFQDRNPEPLFDNFFTKDALWAAQGYPELNGSAEMRPFFEVVTENYLVAIEPVKTFVCGDAGWDFVNYPVMPRDNDEKPWTFRVLFCWIRRDGQWRVNSIVSFQANELN